MSSNTIALKSTGVSRILLWLLRISLVEYALSKVLILIEFALSATPPTIAILQYLLNDPLFIPSLLVTLAIPLLSLVWIYRLHEDLHQCYNSYPIDAWDAVVSLIFIIFMWKTLMTIARYFKTEKGRLYYYGLFLHRLIPVMYGVFIASYLLEKLFFESSEGILTVPPIINIPDSLVPIAIACQDILGVVGGFVLLAIAQTIVSTMQLKVRQINHFEE